MRGVPTSTFRHRIEGSRGSGKFVPAVALPDAAHRGCVRRARIRAVISEDPVDDEGIRQSYSMAFRRLGIGYEVIAAYEVAMTPEKWDAISGESQRKWSCRYGEMGHIDFSDHLVEIIEDLNTEAIAPGTAELAQTDPRRPYGAFSFLPPRNEFDWSLRAALFLPDHRLHPRPFAATLEQLTGRITWTAYETRTVSITYDPSP